MIIYAPAKVNLHLRVLGKRKDGYHNIDTIFERISLSDKIVLRSLKQNKIEVFCDHSDVPTDENGLIYKTIALLKKKYKISKGIRAEIFKKIPIAAGLGGGSSDAAAVLTGLNKLWRLSLTRAELIKLGNKLGSDIAFFINENSFARGTQRGNKITPLAWKTKFWHLLVAIPISVLSKDVYAAIAPCHPEGEKRPKDLSKRVFGPAPRFARDFAGFRMTNDLESIVLEKEPIVRRLKNALKDIGLSNSLVSGSGPSVFSLFDKRKEAVRAKELLVKSFPVVNSKGWHIFVVSTL